MPSICSACPARTRAWRASSSAWNSAARTEARRGRRWRGAALEAPNLFFDALVFVAVVHSASAGRQISSSRRRPSAPLSRPTSRPAVLQRIPKETRAVRVRLADVTASSAQVGRPEGERGIFLRSAASAEAGRGSAPGGDSCGRSGFLGRSARPPGDPTPVQPGAPKSPPKVPRSRRHDACVRGSFAQRGRDPSPTSGVMSGRGSCRQLSREACVARPVDVEGASWGLNPDTRYGTRPDGYLPVGS